MTAIDTRAEQEHDRARFESEVRDLMPPLLAYFSRRVQPYEDAADCLSETLTVLWRRRRQLPVGDVDLRAWSFGVAKHVLANHHRSRVRRDSLADRLRSQLALEPLTVSNSDAGPVNDALKQLRSIDRELVTLVAWDGFGVAEAGRVLGLKPDAARTRYSRARARLRVLLE